MACWEVLLSEGQEWDWYNAPFGRVQLLFVGFAGGLAVLVVRELRTASPIIGFRVLRERNLAISCGLMLCAFAVRYAANMILPGLLQTLFGDDALRSGLMVSPSGVSSMAAMVTVSVLVGRGLDARWMVAAGLIIMAAANYARAKMNLEIGPWQVIWPHMVLMLGLGLFFAPLSVAACKYTPVQMRGAAAGLLNLLRNEGGSVGTSLS